MNPEDPDVYTLAYILSEGGAARLAHMMAAAGKLFPSFLETLTHEEWPVRLGAMVAFEYLAETEPELAAAAAEPLLELFEQASDTIRGDILHTLSLTGRKDLLPRIRAIARGPFSEEIREAAVEAVEAVDANG